MSLPSFLDAYSKHLLDAEGFLDVYSADPAYALTLLYNDLNVAAQLARELFPVVDPERPVAALLCSGVGTNIAWDLDLQRLPPAKSRAYLYWPSLVEKALDNIVVLPGAVYLLYGFRHLLQWRAPCIADLLFRELRNHFLQESIKAENAYSQGRTAYVNIPELHPLERRVLQNGLTLLSRDVQFTSLLKEEFDRVYCACTADQPSGKEVAGVLLTKDVHRNISVLNTRKLGQNIHRLKISTSFAPPTRVIKSLPVNYFRFSPGKMAYEIQYLMDFAYYSYFEESPETNAELREEFGVGGRLDRLTQEYVRYAYVYLPQWTRYRVDRARKDYVALGFLGKEALETAKLHPEMYLTALGRYSSDLRHLQLEAVFPEGISWMSELAEMGNAAFGKNADISSFNIAVLDMYRVQQYLLLCKSRTEHTRKVVITEKQLREQHVRAKANNSVEVFRLPKALDVLFVDRNTVEHKAQVLRRNHQYYFWAEWFPELEKIMPKMSRRRTGMYMSYVTQRRYFTLSAWQEVLEDIPSDFVYASAANAFLETMRRYDRVGPREYKHLLKQQSDQDNMKDYVDIRDAVLQYYKPGMTAEQREALCQLGRVQSISGLSRLAKRIRFEQYEKGIFSEEALPHIHRTQSFCNEVKEAKQRWEKRKKKPGKDY